MSNVLGFEFVEFSGPKDSLTRLFKQLGINNVAQHEKHDIVLYDQGKTNLLINNSGSSHSKRFSNQHINGGVSSFAIKVNDAQRVYETAISRGATSAHNANAIFSDTIPSLYGVGGTIIYITDNSFSWDHYFSFPDRKQPDDSSIFTGVDHLTNLVSRGESEKWSEFYKKFFDFKLLQQATIKGKDTGMAITVMGDENFNVKIPLTEGLGQEHGQNEQFIVKYGGEGVQHIALSTNDIFNAVISLQESGIKFLEAPKNYYKDVRKRLCNKHNDAICKLEKTGVLIDKEKSDEGYLLQIFTKSVLGPVFIEIIERHDSKGFGNGNIQALFDSLERDFSHG